MPLRAHLTPVSSPLSLLKTGTLVSRKLGPSLQPLVTLQQNQWHTLSRYLPHYFFIVPKVPVLLHHRHNTGLQCMYRPRATYLIYLGGPFAVPSSLPDQENSPSYELKCLLTAHRPSQCRAPTFGSVPASIRPLHASGSSWPSCNGRSSGASDLGVGGLGETFSSMLSKPVASPPPRTR